MKSKSVLAALFASLTAAALSAMPATARADTILVVNGGTGTIGEYTTAGAVVNASFIAGLDVPHGITVSGGDLFVASNYGNTVGEYTTSGATVNASLITAGLSGPIGIAVSGNDVFVANYEVGTIGEYTTSGATVNASLVTGLSAPIGIAVLATPEPSTWVMFVIGAAGLLACGRRRRHS